MEFQMTSDWNQNVEREIPPHEPVPSRPVRPVPSRPRSDIRVPSLTSYSSEAPVFAGPRDHCTGRKPGLQGTAALWSNSPGARNPTLARAATWLSETKEIFIIFICWTSSYSSTYIYLNSLRHPWITRSANFAFASTLRNQAPILTPVEQYLCTIYITSESNLS